MGSLKATLFPLEAFAKAILFPLIFFYYASKV